MGKKGSIDEEGLLRGDPFLVAAPIFILAYAFLLDEFIMRAISWPIWIRYLTAVFVIFPAGFVMGMFFPAGVRMLAHSRGDLIPWAWAVNASVSVVGSVMAVVIALSWGFTTVFCVAAGAYVLAILTLPARHGKSGGN